MTFLSSTRQPEVDFLHSCDFEQTFGQIISIIVETLSNTNLVASKAIKREKNSLPVDVRRSKTLVLKLPISLYVLFSHRWTDSSNYATFYACFYPLHAWATRLWSPIRKLYSFLIKSFFLRYSVPCCSYDLLFSYKRGLLSSVFVVGCT